MASKLDHLNLSVHDFDETVAWYNKIFDFSVVEEKEWMTGRNGE